MEETQTAAGDNLATLGDEPRRRFAWCLTRATIRPISSGTSMPTRASPPTSRNGAQTNGGVGMETKKPAVNLTAITDALGRLIFWLLNLFVTIFAPPVPRDRAKQTASPELPYLSVTPACG